MEWGNEQSEIQGERSFCWGCIGLKQLGMGLVALRKASLLLSLFPPFPIKGKKNKK